jgi:regulatory protein
MEKTVSSGPSGKKEEYKAFLERAASACSRSEHSSGQVRVKLQMWKVPEEWIDRILATLKEQKFVDDRRYASLFVKDKFRLNKWGKVKIAHLLRQHGIGEEMIRFSLEEIDEGEYYELCRSLIRSKSATLKERNPYARKGKLFRYASSKGFEPDLIYRVIADEER